MPRSRMRGEHIITTTLDPQRGGWVWRCSCGEEAKRPRWYKARAVELGKQHKAVGEIAGKVLG